MTWRFNADSFPPADLAEAIASIGQEIGTDADVDAVIGALRARNLGFLKSIMGLRAIKGMPLGEAKWLVHRHPAYADELDEREDFWEALHDEVMRQATDMEDPDPKD